MTDVASGEAADSLAILGPVRERGVALSAETTAWLAIIPCAAITALVVLLLGPGLSHVLFPRPHIEFLPGEIRALAPEPLEDTRYVLMLIGPVLLATVIARTSHRRLASSPRWTTTSVRVARGLLVAFVIICLIGQHRPEWGDAYFSWSTLAVAALLTAMFVCAVHNARVRAWAEPLLRDTRLRRTALLAAAAALTAIWLLPAVNSEASVRWSFFDHDTQFHLDETFAVLNGLTPLTDFNAQYASLLPYVIALSMRAFGTTVLVFTITACVLSALSLLALYGVLRRAAGNAPVAFVLFVPFMATSLFFIAGISLIRFTPAVYFPMFPLRYGGACLLAWLTARHIERGRSSSVWPLFVAAGFVVLNNVEFGVAALAATFGALLATSVPAEARRLLRFGGAIVAGLGIAAALYSLFALARAGALPRFWSLAEFARLYGVAGYSVGPMPGILGLPLVMYLTHVAAIGTATVRSRRREANRVLTGMLIWAGIFGLGSATYYVARSHRGALALLFPAWALSLALLAIVVLRLIAVQPRRAPSLAGFAVLFSVGLMVCSLAQVPSPGPQIERIQALPDGIEAGPANWDPPSRNPRVRRFVSSLADGPERFVVRRGAPVAVFTTMGHRLAEAYGIADVLPYTGPESIHTREQLDDSLDALESAGGNTALVPVEHVKQLRGSLLVRSFAIVTRTGLRTPSAHAAKLPVGTIVVEGLTKWVDTRHLHPAALR